MSRKYWGILAVIASVFVVYVGFRQTVTHSDKQRVTGGAAGRTSENDPSKSYQTDADKTSDPDAVTVAAQSEVTESSNSSAAKTAGDAGTESPVPNSGSNPAGTASRDEGQHVGTSVNATSPNVGLAAAEKADTNTSSNQKSMGNTIPGQKLATVTPQKATQGILPPEGSPNVPAQKMKPSFPGIDQPDDDIMVSDVRHKGGEGEDTITVALSRVEGHHEVEGVIWVIGEYIQRGTTGVMYMPSHNELKVAADGKPKFPNNGPKFQMRLGVEKKFTVKRPGFEGEEIVGVRVGIVEKSTGKVHLAHISMKQIQKKTAAKRVKVHEQ